jgi:hypothetical protein
VQTHEMTNEADEFGPGGMWESNPLVPTDEIVEQPEEDENGRDQEA